MTDGEDEMWLDFGWEFERTALPLLPEGETSNAILKVGIAVRNYYGSRHRSDNAFQRGDWFTVFHAVSRVHGRSTA
jgi:hypothetical protein